MLKRSDLLIEQHRVKAEQSSIYLNTPASKTSCKSEPRLPLYLFVGHRTSFNNIFVSGSPPKLIYIYQRAVAMRSKKIG